MTLNLSFNPVHPKEKEAEETDDKRCSSKMCKNAEPVKIECVF